MTIRNIQRFVDNLWDWGILDGCFGDTRIKPTDLDGLVERCGNILILEAKSPGKSVTTGQKILFDNLLRLNSLVGHQVFTVIVIWGETNNPERIQQWGQLAGNADTVELRRRVANWFSWASSNKFEYKTKGRNGYESSGLPRHIQ